MTRQSSPPNASSTKPQGQPASRKIPAQARDCGPQVDTWPILDTQADDAAKPKAEGRRNSKS